MSFLYITLITHAQLFQLMFVSVVDRNEKPETFTYTVIYDLPRIFINTVCINLLYFSFLTVNDLNVVSSLHDASSKLHDLP